MATLLLAAAPPLRAQSTVLVPGTVFRPPVPPPALGFGRAVGGRGQSPFRADGSGASLVVGAPLTQGSAGGAAGRVYTFSDPYDAKQVIILDSPSPADGGQFGAAVAPIGPGDVLIGAPGENGGAGALYRAQFAAPPFSTTTSSTSSSTTLFSSTTTSSTTPPSTAPPSIETIPHSQVSGEAFGAAVAVAGQVALVGAPAFNVQDMPGSAYLIDTTTPGAAPRKLGSPTPSAGALFGATVAFSPDGFAAFVGAPFEGGTGHETGAVYRFDAATGVLVRTFANPGTANPGGGVQDGFGAAVAAGPDFVVVGAPFADAGAEGAGAAYVFDDSGSLIRTIANPNPTADASFGAAVAVVGSRILVGAPFDDGDVEDGGAVYVFDGDRGSPAFGMPADSGRLALPVPTRSAMLGSSIAPVGTAGDVAVGALGSDDVGNGLAIVFAACGNGIMAGEQCDPPGDGCSATCTNEPPVCGAPPMSISSGLPRAVAQSTGVFCGCADPAGAACDDGIDCTAPDTCSGPGGQCVGTPHDSLCDDGNPCTDDRCDAAAGCVHQPKVCPDDGDPCTVDECNPATGACSRTALDCDCHTDAECDDGNACNGGELCVRPCKGCNLIRAGRQCCDRALTCQLEFAPPPPGASCDDHDACTADDICQASGQCAGDALTGVASVCCVFQGPPPTVEACAGQRIEPVQKKMTRGAMLAQKACGVKKLAKQRGVVRRELKVLRQAEKATQALGRARGRKPPRITAACRDALLQLSQEPAVPARAFLSSAAPR